MLGRRDLIDVNLSHCLFVFINKYGAIQFLHLHTTLQEVEVIKGIQGLLQHTLEQTVEQIR